MEQKKPIVLELDEKNNEPWIDKFIREDNAKRKNYEDLGGIDRNLYTENQTFVKNFTFSAEEIGYLNTKMENRVWQWLADNNPMVISTSQSITVKDGKYHLNLTIFYKFYAVIKVGVEGTEGYAELVEEG